MSRSRAKRTRGPETGEDEQSVAPEGSPASVRDRGGGSASPVGDGASGRDHGLGNAATGRLIAPSTVPGASRDGAAPALQDVLGQRAVGNAAASRVVAQRSQRTGAGPRPDATRQVESVLRSPGERLPAEVARSMEPVVGTGIDGVRIHSDGAAARSAQALDANAYTVGGHVVFGSERYAPTTEDGRSLLAHELTHVAQQGASTRIPPADSLAVTRPSDRSERAADAVAERATRPSVGGGQARHAAAAPAIARQPVGGGTDTKPSPPKSPTGILWEDALATMNAIKAVLPNVQPSGVVLPKFGDVSIEELRALDAMASGQPSGASEAGAPFPESVLANVPPRYHALVRDWHFVVHPINVSPSGVTFSIYGTMRETHLNQDVAETQRLVNELATEGEASSTDPYLASYWKSVAALRNEIGLEVVAEAAEQAKATVAGLSFEGESENEHAKTAIDKATEAAHIAVKVATQFEEHAIEHAAEHAAHEAKRLRTLEGLLADAGQEGAWPAYREGMLKSAAKMDVVSGLTYLEGALHGLAGILAITDPVKREEMLRKRPDLIGGIAAGAQIEKVVLQLAAGATAVVGATAYAFARLLGKEALAAEVLSKGIKVLEKFEVVISAVMVVHGVLTLLDSEASAEEKEEAALETAIGATPLIAKFTGAFEGGPATLAVVISFFTLKALAEAAYSFSVDLVKISLNMCYHQMRRDGLTVNDDGLRLSLALKLYQLETDPDRKGMLWSVIPTLRANLSRNLAEAIHRATEEAGARDQDPAAHEPLRRRFAPLATRKLDTDIDILEAAQEYVHTVAEALAHPQEILDEDVKDTWEKHG